MNNLGPPAGVEGAGGTMTSGAMTVGAASGGAVTGGVGRSVSDVEGVGPTPGAVFSVVSAAAKT